ncbi:cell wall metabolism sensor histidine kinase WalK [Anaeromyxobacter sp. Fw109-5]|uniref:sensor histidine kinase n=1 Tax=Anaeromyxobacter sp. (strain Fw109-5) TaxID=404589 RepID=UPI0000ED7B6E|nr:ATP-binding protein [Anaeromyxobacter sp. Fw109-5]ABS28644.1 histidine kinase [Anaeromyxobacter sp. Fw109-5]
MTVPPSFLQQRLPLGDLLDLRSFGDVCHSFSELYRIGIKVFDEAGNKLVDVRVGNADFCGYIWTKAAGREGCIATVGKVKSDPLPEEPVPRTVQCFSGCRYVVQPILYEGDLLGRVVFGPFVPEDLAELPAALRDIAPDFDAKLAQGYLEKIRRVPVSTAEKILKHFMDLLDVMVFTGHKNLIAAKLHIEAVQESYRELQEKNRELEDSYAKLKELDRLKSNFLATMSHELRTPLTSVIGYSEMMLEGLGGPLTAEQREYLGIIMEKGENLLQLITSILDISKIEAGRVRLVLSDVDATQIMRDAIATVLPLARKKGLKVACDAGAMPRVQADRDKLRQCLVNLCSNAVKFTPAGGTIAVSAEALPGDRLAIHVADTGIGIGEEHLGKVFDVFYQVDGSSTREYGGAGLGLAIVKSFVEAHGGEVGVRSIPGVGTTFTVILPLRPSLVPAYTPVIPMPAVGRVF